MATPTDSGESAESQVAEVLGAIKKVETNMDEKLSQMRREMHQERDTADERLVKRMRMNKQPSFKKPGHEKQFHFNDKVRDKLEKSDAALVQQPPAVEKARAALQEGQKLIELRQKLIKIADRSEHGWATVAEYEEDELADNSDDEKRLFRAEARAGRRSKQKTSKSLNIRKKGAQAGASSRAPGSVVPRTPTGGVAELAQASLLVQNLLSPLTARQSLPAAERSQLGPCFMCGKMGHLRRACPLLQGSSSSKTL